MPRRSKPLTCSEEQKNQLLELVNDSHTEPRLLERCRIILACIGPHRADLVAQELGVNVCTVLKWRERFRKLGLEGLQDGKRSGRPVIYGEEVDARIHAKLAETPPDGQDRWDGRTLARALGISADAVWRYARKHNILLARKRLRTTGGSSGKS